MEKDKSTEITNIEQIFDSYDIKYNKSSNPLTSQANISANNLKSYTKTTEQPKYDEDISKIVEVVRILNNMAPVRMPEYNFNIDEINGERFYKPDGTLLLVRDFDNEVIRDYYYNPNFENSQYSVSRIYEHDKNTGRLKVKIEPITRTGSRLKSSITIFDEKINNKYIIIQLSDGGIVNNFSEFSGKGKSFKTLFRNIYTFKPVRFIEGKDSAGKEFEMVDCLFNEAGEVVRIKRYNNKNEVSIDYSNNKKQVTVKKQ